MQRLAAVPGGQSSLSADDYVEGAPELIVEVAASSAYDMHDKRHVYRRSGVLEYIVWRVHDEALDWFVLVGDEYQQLAPDQGVLVSPTFPGLRLATHAMLAGDDSSVLAELRKGLEQPVHATFVAALLAAANT